MEDREIRAALACKNQYFGDRFEPGPSRPQWVERIP